MSQKSQAQIFADQWIDAPRLEFVSPDNQYRVVATVGVWFKDQTIPTLSLTSVDAKTHQIQHLALRNDNALALAAFIQKVFSPPPDEVTLAS